MKLLNALLCVFAITAGTSAFAEPTRKIVCGVNSNGNGKDWQPVAAVTRDIVEGLTRFDMPVKNSYGQTFNVQVNVDYTSMLGLYYLSHNVQIPKKGLSIMTISTGEKVADVLPSGQKIPLIKTSTHHTYDGKVTFGVFCEIQ